ncbi:MAG TPA: transcriptional activator domain-containing protein, partial [Microlunatus sp.]
PPRLVVLATSQALLGLAEERPYELAPLPQRESVALFEQRARQLRRGLALDSDSRAAIAEICRSLDGLPLAIELAAARARSLSVHDIARRLDDRFGLLRDPSSSRPERRRALAGAIAWSYDLLFPDDQRALWALSCFVGSASLGGVERVLAALEVPPEAVADTIGRLVDRSLVMVEDAGSGELRYRLLDSIRLYAADRLRESTRAAAAHAAQADWCARLADWCERHVRSARQPECLAIARTERANVDAALRWCATHDPVLGARIATDFGWTWVVLGDGTAGAARVRNALTGDVPSRDLVTGRLLVAWLESSAGNVSDAQRDLDRARELAGALADDVLIADVERHQAFVAIQEGRPALARSAAASSLIAYRAHRLGWSTAAALLLGAYGSLMLGDVATASDEAAEALTILEPLGDAWGLVHAQAMLGAVAQAEHRFADAARTLEGAADASLALGFLGQAALHRASLARVQQRAGDPRAAASYDQALEMAAASGDGRLAATARLNLARLRRSHGDEAGALALWVENDHWYDAAGGGDLALLNRSLLAAARGEEGELTRVLAEAEASSDRESAVCALDGLARSAAVAGDLSRAAALLERADLQAATIGHLLDPADRLDADTVRPLISAVPGLISEVPDGRS